MHKRILLKLSGEMLQGGGDFGIAPLFLEKLAEEIQSVLNLGIQIGIVIGGGNIFRGAELKASGMTQAPGDQMGMLATVMNGIAIEDAFNRLGIKTKLLSAVDIPQFVESYRRDKALAALGRGEVVVFAGGTNNPFFTTDTAASLRAIQIEANLLLKATKVDGVYDKDPVKYADATRFEQLTYGEVIEKQLRVMDLNAICLCRDHKMPLRVFDFSEMSHLTKILNGNPMGTLITEPQDD